MGIRRSATGLDYGGMFTHNERAHYIELLARTWLADPHRTAWAQQHYASFQTHTMVRVALILFDDTTRGLANTRHGQGLNDRDVEKINKEAAKRILRMPTREWIATAARIQDDPNAHVGTPPWFEHPNHDDPDTWPMWARHLISELDGTAPPQPLP